MDDIFKIKIHDFLNDYRLAGYDLEINGPIYVAIDIKIIVYVGPNHYQSQVKQALFEIFSNSIIQYKSRKGFFHPDNFTFGQSLYLSDIYKTAMKVEGVVSVNIERFKRWHKSDDAHSELDAGVIKMNSFEITRLDNDPNFPENGTIEFVLNGGL